uniref:Uncharacterized protein n=1 Tax=Arundo donax TaxID=35708 RepID=A0A0A8XZA1_ARUDO
MPYSKLLQLYAHRQLQLTHSILCTTSTPPSSPSTKRLLQTSDGTKLEEYYPSPFATNNTQLEFGD